jgi:dTDP-glucose 4,6-dehydratase
MLAARLGRRLPLDGGGVSRRCFIHIDDVCRATYDLIYRGQIGDAYHISGTEPISIRDLISVIAEITEVQIDQLVTDVGERLGKDQDYLLDSQKLRSELEWTDLIGLRRGLDETLSWIDNNIGVLSQLPVEYIHKA